MIERASKIDGWLAYLEDLYEGLISRTSETNSIAGFDPTPEQTPCRHPQRHMRGRLCLVCENTGWRRVYPWEQGIDPYATDLKPGVTVALQSPSATAAAQAERINALIAALERGARVESGEEAPETRELRNFRLVAHKHTSLVRIIATLGHMRSAHPSLLRLPRPDLCALLARIVPGSISPSPCV